MQIEIKIDSLCTEPRIIIITDKMTEEINHMLKKLSKDTPQIIAGFKDDKFEMLKQEEVIHIYANSGKVFAVTENGRYVIRSRLYELEEQLDESKFVRISNSEIINLERVKNFDLSITGTICVKLSNDTVTYVSRRYVTKIKKLLGI
ncbi:MAG: LytTR family transcriptional regulator [Lachnospiraceae bacterium]|jgi:DNA-binding LytR/AlgR family response regulator|nr:LytTR family transcriptional regulator [Lachnospiraceae bacterium]